MGERVAVLPSISIDDPVSEPISKFHCRACSYEVTTQAVTCPLAGHWTGMLPSSLMNLGKETPQSDADLVIFPKVLLVHRDRRCHVGFEIRSSLA